MDARSETTLAGVDPTLAALVHAAAAVLEPQGIFMCVYQGYRTAAQQNALYAEGRTVLKDAQGNPLKIVTKARAGQSNHNYGMAVDVVPYLHGNAGALNWDDSTPQYKTMVAALKAQGLVYGGDWKSFPDNDHFQLATMPASPSPAMIADFNAGVPLAQMWAHCASGLYMPPGDGSILA